MSPQLLPRRDFLKATSAAALGLTVGGLPTTLFAAATVNAPLLSVGFADHSPAVGEIVALAAAERVLSGDPAFIRRGARVTVSSYHRAPKYDGRAGGGTLSAIYPALGFDPSRYPRFDAWTFAAGRDATDNGRRAARFAMPVTATQGLQFAVRQIGADAAEAPVALTLGSASDTLKLQRGIYVLALRESNSDAVPSWYGLNIQLVNGDLVVNTTAFSYIVMAVDYAS